MNDMGAGRIGDGQGGVAGTAIGDDHFAHHAAHRRRDQAVETARQQALGIHGGDDDRNHDSHHDVERAFRAKTLRRVGYRVAAP